MCVRPVSVAFALVLLLVMTPVAEASAWSPASTPTSSLLRSAAFYDEATGLAVGSGHTVVKTTDGGETWTETMGGLFGFGWYDVAWASPTTAYAVGANAIFQPTVAVSQNGGQSWGWQNFYINNNEGTLYGVGVSATSVLISATLWNGQGVILQRPTAAPVGWTPALQVATPLTGMDADGLFAVAVGYDGQVYVSQTGGLTWAPALSGTSAWLLDVSVKGTQAIAVGTDGTIVRSDDLGATWTVVDSGTADRLRSVALTPSGAAIAVGDGGVVLSSTDAGATWAAEASGTTRDLWGAAMHEGVTGSAAVAVGAGGTALVRGA